MITELRNLSTKDRRISVRSIDDKYYMRDHIGAIIAEVVEISENTYYQLLTEDMNAYSNRKELPTHREPK